MNDWQSIAAAAIVLATVVIVLRRLFRKRKSGSCGHDCGCGKK